MKIKTTLLSECGCDVGALGVVAEEPDGIEGRFVVQWHVQLIVLRLVTDGRRAVRANF